MLNQKLGLVIKPPYTSESVTARDPRGSGYGESDSQLCERYVDGSIIAA